MSKISNINQISLIFVDGTTLEEALGEGEDGILVDSIYIDYDKGIVAISIENEKNIDEEIYPLHNIKKIAYTKERMNPYS